MISLISVKKRSDAPVVVELFGVSMSFGTERVLEDVHLRLNQGEFVLLIGDNGTGKTTLCRVLLGELIPQSGRVMIGGHTPSKIGVAERANVVRFVPQNVYEYFIYDSVGREIEHTIAGRQDNALVALMGAVAELGVSVPAGARPFDLGFFDAWRLACLLAASGGPSVVIVDEAPAIDRPEVEKTLRTCHNLIAPFGGVMIGTAHKVPGWARP